MSDNIQENTTATNEVAVVTKEVTATVAPKKEKLVKVKALNNLAGAFLLPYCEGQTFSIDAVQAAEIVESKNGEYVIDTKK